MMRRLLLVFVCACFLSGCSGLGKTAALPVTVPYYLVKGTIDMAKDMVTGDSSSGGSTATGPSERPSYSGTLFGSNTPLEDTEGYKVLKRIDEENREIERENERRRAENRRRQEEFGRQQAEREGQQQARAEQQRQAEWERQRRQAEVERQRRAEIERRRQEAERERRRQEAEAERQRERRLARQRQPAAWRPRAVPSAQAAHCLEVRRLKGGFNVADLEIRNTCSVPINVSGACSGTSFKADYPYKGTYSPYSSLGLTTLHPDKWKPAVLQEMCNKKGRTARNIACQVPFSPHFTTPDGDGYGCFE